MRWREQIQSKEEDRMASGGRKKLFESVISGAPFIKGLQLLNHRGEDSFSLRFIWLKKGILVEFYYGLYILNLDEMSWLMITNTITLNHWINCHVFNFIYKRIFVTKKYVCCRKSFLLLWPGACSSGEEWADAKFVGYYVVIMGPVSRLASFTLVTVTISGPGHPAIVLRD